MNEPHISLSERPWVRNRHIKTLFKLYDDAEAELRIVGGAVRNALLSRPVTEIDMAINLSPERVMEIAQNAGLQTIPTGIDHGTVTVIMGTDPVRRVEITSLRTDVSTDGRHAEVSYTDDWAEDASRRDFTMNALSCTSAGTIVDPLGAMNDLRQERVRFIGDAEKRVTEDYLRILRFFRFSAEYGDGKVDKEGLSACVKLQAGLNSLSVERIGHEFLRLLRAPHIIKILGVMIDAGIHRDLLPGKTDLSLLEGVMLFERSFGLAADPMRRLAALFLPAHQNGTIDASMLQQKLCLSNKERLYVQRVWEHSAQLVEVLQRQNMTKLLYHWGEALSLDMMSLSFAKDKKRSETEWLAHLSAELRFTPPIFPITGDELIARGMRPGPDLGDELKRLEKIWIDQDFSLSKAELLALSA